jgi:tetratricopeptide (TPR) repeat protein
VYYEQALRIYCEIGAREAEGWGLAALSLLHHHLKDDEAAQDYSQRALFIAQELENHSLQGCALTNLGHALVELGRLSDAVEAYQQALILRRGSSQPHLATESLAGLVRVSLDLGALAQAQDQAEEILSHLKSSMLDGIDEPLRIYLTCYRALHANQDPRAQEILSTAHNLLQERAAKIGDEEMRRSFLENVTAHREIMEQPL